MSYPILNEEEQNLAQLIYSNNPTNDLLVLELLRSREESIQHLLPQLTCVYMTSKDAEVRKKYAAFLGKLISPKQIIHTEEKFNSPRFWMDSFYVIRNYEKEFAAGVFYTYFKRVGGCVKEFLQVGQGHPQRKEVFEYFLQEEQKSRYGSIDIHGWSKEEMFTYFNHPKLDFSSRYRINLNDISIADLPSDLSMLYPVHLNISKCVSDGFPMEVFNFKGISDLTITKMPFSKMPNDWSSFNNLENLSFNNNEYCFENFDFLDSLSKLKNLRIGTNTIARPNVLLRKKRIPLSDYSTLKFREAGLFIEEGSNGYFKLPLNQLLSISTALGKSVLTEAEKEYFFYAISTQKSFKNLPDFALFQYAALLNVSNVKFRNVIQTRLAQLAEKGKGIEMLSNKSLLWIVGTPNMKKLELNQKLKDLHIDYTYKKTPAITHVVLGKHPKEYRLLENINAALITESQLFNLFSREQPKYIQEAVQQGDETIAGNVSSLIFSTDLDSVHVGLELLKSGGVPPELISDLLVLQKTYADSKVRKIAKALLLQNASVEWMPLINDNQRFTSITTAKAQQTNKSLEKLAKNTSRKLAAKLSLLLFKKFGKGLRYILYHFHEPCEERTAALKAMVENKCFDFSKGLGFKKWENPNVAQLYKMKIPAKIKFDVVEHCPEIERINLHNCKMSSLSRDIASVNKLKYLNCSYNFLGSIPKAIGELQHLEELDLKVNAFNAFPSTLKHATSLKKLDLRFNRPDGYTFEPLEVPDDVKEALAGCEILV